MNLRSLKRWQWAMIGLSCGLLLGLGRVVAKSEELVGGPGYINQATFEAELRRPPDPDRPPLVALAIEPRGGIDRVEMSYLVPAAEGATVSRTVLFAAPHPYVPLEPPSGRAAATNYTIGDYLSELARTNPLPPVRYAWWSEANWIVALWALAGLALVGGALPSMLRLVGYAKHEPADERYDLSLLHAGPDAKPESRITSADMERLAELEQEIGKRLAQPDDSPRPAAPQLPSPARQLADAPLSPPAPAAAQIDKTFDGEYYPVERHAPRGFALVELLVVIGITAILISFLMPALRLARMQAQTVRCAAQLRQVGTALHMYANANGGWLPAWSDWHTWPPGQSDDTPGPAWTIELMPYIGSPDSPVYNCPSFPGPRRYRNYFLEAQWAGRSGRHAMKLTDITMTGRFVLSGDKTSLAYYPPPFGAGPMQDDADPDDFGGGGAGMLAWPWSGGFYMHHGGNNVLFDDVHVALFDRYDRRAMTFNPHRMQDWVDVTPD